MPKKKNKDYEIGYGKPPKHSQFKKGRPKKKTEEAFLPTQRLLREQLFRAALRNVTVKENGVPKTMPAMEAVFNQLVAQAAAGKPSALRLLITEIKQRTDEHEYWQLEFYKIMESISEHREIEARIAAEEAREADEQMRDS
jgi:Family of unknown function (DUF5681)